MAGSRKTKVEPLAFVLMWNPSIQDKEEAGFDRAVQQLETGQRAIADWAVDKPTVSKHIQPGDTVFLRRVGGSRSQRGIVADAIVLSEPFSGRTYRPDEDGTSRYVELEWINLQPDAPMPSSAVGAQLSVLENQGGSGAIVDPIELEALESAWRSHLESVSSRTTEFDAYDDISGGSELERRYAYREVRRYQARFRKDVLAHWGACCSVCQLDQIEIIQAAHLKAHADGGSTHRDNGRPLCANHHLAFDRGLLVWESSGERFVWADGINEF